MQENKNLAVFLVHDIKAVLFDKDGTILDFDKTWMPLWEAILAGVKETFGLKEEHLQAFHHALGVTGKGCTPSSIFVQSHFEHMLDAAYAGSALDEDKKDAIIAYVRDFVQNRAKDYAKAHAIPGVPDVIRAIKGQGFLVGLVTSDLEPIAMEHMKDLGLSGVFDYMACDNGVRKLKPHRDILDEVCEKFGILPHEVAMVGDAVVDMQFAKDNGMGYGIYVRSGYPDEKGEKMADMILDDVTQLVMSK